MHSVGVELATPTKLSGANVKVLLAVVWQPLLSVTVTIYSPAALTLMLLLELPDALFQE